MYSIKRCILDTDQIRFFVPSKLCESSPFSFELKVHSYNGQQRPRCLALGFPDLTCYSPPLSHRHIFQVPATPDSLLFFRLCKYPPPGLFATVIPSLILGMFFSQIFARQAPSPKSLCVSIISKKPPLKGLFTITRPPHSRLQGPITSFFSCFIALITH